MKNFKNSQQMVFKEKGSVLIISLVLLTAITLISITSLQRTSLQTRIVANIQHAESGFNIASNELEEIYLTYNSGSSTKDLTQAIDNFTLDSDGNQSFGIMDTSITSTYQTANLSYPHSIQVTNKLLHKGVSLFTSGYSQGGFSTYNFEVQSDSSTPNNGHNLSSQSLGLELIGPSAI
jgi:Tfp pilus assembly protein PilX